MTEIGKTIITLEHFEAGKLKSKKIKMIFISFKYLITKE